MHQDKAHGSISLTALGWKCHLQIHIRSAHQIEIALPIHIALHIYSLIPPQRHHCKIWPNVYISYDFQSSNLSAQLGCKLATSHEFRA